LTVDLLREHVHCCALADPTRPEHELLEKIEGCIACINRDILNKD
jgi:hypothetical protein